MNTEEKLTVDRIEQIIEAANTGPYIRNMTARVIFRMIGDKQKAQVENFLGMVLGLKDVKKL